jgi:4-amino-4-deoxy-L-arabinose transferase-like glycosyltransferase
MRHHTEWIFVAILLACFAVNWFLCSQSGALDSDLGGDPDEAAHAVTALMVRDYLVDGFGQSPMKFARDYYEHFPRVALGHYPPFYYLVAGIFLVFWDSIKVLFVLQALLMALLSALTWLLGQRFLSSWFAGVAAVLGCVLPVGLKLMQHVMSDVMLAVLCLWAALAWTDYLRAPSTKKSLLWGCIAAAAILTKGSGIMLCALPPLATVLAGKWNLIRTFSWWCAAGPVALLAGPWMIYSTSISKEGMTDLTPAQYLVEAVPYYMKSIPFIFGWGITLLAFTGIAAGLWQALKKRVMSVDSATLFALLAGAFAVLILVPVGLTTRYMLTVVPVVMLTAAYGVQFLTRCLPHRGGLISGTLVLMMAFSFIASFPRKEVLGFSEAVLMLSPDVVHEADARWLVSSDPRGEGAVIASAAFQSVKRVPSKLSVYRAGKELASSDWMGRGYKTSVDAPEALLDLLDKRNITWIIIDLSVPEHQRRSHEHLLEKTLESSVEKWALVHEQQVKRRVGQSGCMLIYQRRTVPQEK